MARYPFVDSCALFVYNIFKISFCRYTLIMWHFFRYALFSCFVIFNVRFSGVVLFSCCTFSVLQSFHIGLFSCCTFFVLLALFFLIALFSFNLRLRMHVLFLTVTVFPCCTRFTFYKLHSFHITLFSCCYFPVLNYFHVTLFSYCTIFMLLFWTALFSCCTVIGRYTFFRTDPMQKTSE